MHKLRGILNGFTNLEKKLCYVSSLLISVFLILGLSGITFAWVNNSENESTKNKELVVNSENLKIKYKFNNKVVGNNITPGFNLDKEFTVENTGDQEETYSIYFNKLTNNFSMKKKLLLSINSDNYGKSLEEVKLPNTGEYLYIIKDAKIAPGVKQTYSLNINYSKKSKGNVEGDFSGEIGVYNSRDEKLTQANLKILSVAEEKKDGLITLNMPKTKQTSSSKEYRYTGINARNYVKFNNELWRIIGLFNVQDENGNFVSRVKLIKDSSVGNYSWDSSNSSVNSGFGVNEWSKSDIKKILNESYYNSKKGKCYINKENTSKDCDFTKIGLKEDSRKMIEKVKWYTGGWNTEDVSSDVMYQKERGNALYKGTSDDLTRSKSWIGYIGLSYPSDYGFASSGCYKNKVLFEMDETKCNTTNWMYNKMSFWLISPFNNYSSTAFSVNNNGFAGNNGEVSTAKAIRPNLYLKEKVKIIKGNGTIANPYLLSM